MSGSTRATYTLKSGPLSFIAEAPHTYIRTSLDLSNRSIVELSGVSLPVVDLVLLLDTGSVTLKATLVDIVDPGKMGLGGSGVDTRLKGDDELSRDDIGPLGDGSRGGEDSREQSPKEDGKVANVDHPEDGRDGPVEETENLRLILG